jgi:hypothetical protein
VPRWLLLTLLGIGLGAGGVLFLQERYLPPRLSAEASAELRESFERADAERQRLQTELAATSGRLRTTLDENKRLAAEVSARGETVQRLRQDITALVESLRPTRATRRWRCVPLASTSQATPSPTTSCCRANAPVRARSVA